MYYKNNAVEFAKHTFLILVLMLGFIGLYLMLNISLKDNAQFSSNPWFPEAPFHWKNYIFGWQQIAPSILNTVFVVFTQTVLSIIIALVGAFFFARYKLKGSNLLFYIFIILMIYPSVSNMVPAFKLISSLGLYNSHWALILGGIAGAQAMLIYVFRNFIEDIPKDLFDAAEIDGCSILMQIWHIVVPMSKPIMGTLGILNIIGSWNDFVGPLIFIRDNNKQLISVALLNLEGEYTKQWGQLMAGYTIGSIPLIILFIFCMRLFIRGLSEGAVKG